MANKKRGFTLIELLAVIVILGLLMAIAIPSVTKYITQSRKKTVTTTIGNYISALTNQVNDMEYVFTATNTVYAVPIECIALERGGNDPFGRWLHANDKYWAYVLVQYDDKTSSYTYGFTFKDSAGYGLYPTSIEKLNEGGKQINTGLDLTKPISGTITNITALSNWTGFNVDDTTKLHVLEATAEGVNGDGINTCTLCQKGDNFDEIQASKPTLSNLIKKHNTIITTLPTLTTSSNNTSDTSGLYSSTNTNSGNPTYYFRGNVTNNYVSFANETWRIVRINEDGSVKLIMEKGINSKLYDYNSTQLGMDNMYYSNSDIAKPTVDDWYQKNIVEKGYDSYVVTQTFCEQAKVKKTSSNTSGSATMKLYSSYVPDFKCSNDGNGKGILNLKVGLITYDEVMYAGGYMDKDNSKYYLYINRFFWTMSPAGYYSNTAANVWNIYNDGSLYTNSVAHDNQLRPVINLNTYVMATGTGTSSDPYIVK